MARARPSLVRASSSVTRMTWSIVSVLAARPVERETDDKDGAPAAPVVAGNAPPVLLDDPPDDGKPETEAVSPAAHERQEDPLLLGLGNPWSGIHDGDLHPLFAHADLHAENA